MNERMEKESDDDRYERNMTTFTKCTCQNNQFKYQRLRTRTFLITIKLLTKV
jgi:hypothetical protein